MIEIYLEVVTLIEVDGVISFNYPFLVAQDKRIQPFLIYPSRADHFLSVF